MKNWALFLFDCDGEIISTHKLFPDTKLSYIENLIAADNVCSHEIFPIEEEIVYMEDEVVDFGNLPLKP